MNTTLIVTNDFPPRQGGIETFVHAMATRVPGNDVVVYTSSEPGAAAYDATLPFPVIRDPSRMLLPTPASPARPCGSPVNTAVTGPGSGRRRRSPRWPRHCDAAGCAAWSPPRTATRSGGPAPLGHAR